MAEIPQEAEWLLALQREDGYRLMTLLAEEPRLLTVKYRGCNVLHLAIRHNWYGLVEEVLRKFEDHSQSRAGEIQSENGPAIDLTTLKDLLTAKEGDDGQIWSTDTSEFYASGLDVFAMAVIQGHGHIKTLLGTYVSEKFDCLFDDRHHYKNVFRRVIDGLYNATTAFAGSNQLQEENRRRLRKIMEESFNKWYIENKMEVSKEAERDSEQPNFAPLVSVTDSRRTAESQSSTGSSSDQNERLEDKIKVRWIERWKLTSPFLPLEEFLFLACQEWFPDDSESLNLVFRRCHDSKDDKAFMEYLLTINDSRGTALNHAVVNQRTSYLSRDVNTCFELCFKLIPNGGEFGAHINTRDNLGRTPLLTAITLGREEECKRLLGDPRTDVNATYDPYERMLGCKDDVYEYDRRWAMNVITISEVNGYWPPAVVSYTALHLLIFNPSIPAYKRRTIMEVLLRRKDLNVNYLCRRDTEVNRAGYRDLEWMSPLQLAAYVGDTVSLGLLANDDRTYDPAKFHNSSPKPYDDWDEGYSALHIAALSGHAQAIRIILATGKFNPLVRDPKRDNTALHLAIRFAFPFHFPHSLTDFFRIPVKRQGTSYTPTKSLMPMKSLTPTKSLTPDERDGMIRTAESQRQGCINSLLHVGIDIWHTDKTKPIEDAGPEASPEYSAWCYERISRKTQEVKSSLTAAANAISVTGALVATASYVGPLQPPLGYAEGLQVSNLLVRTFIVCNTLAFYIALAAILLSLTPSLPMPQESTLDDLKVLRRSVNLAVFLLILSIVAFLLAFASASISIIPDQGSWNHGGLTAGTFVVGGMICLGALIFCIYLTLRVSFIRRRFWSYIFTIVWG